MTTIEEQIVAKGKTAPRVTPKDIEANIAEIHFFTAAEGVCGGARGGHIQDPTGMGALSLLTFCVLVLQNGYTVHGISACASPENFDADIGRDIAFENAKQAMWPLLGYELRSRLHATPG